MHSFRTRRPPTPSAGDCSEFGHSERKYCTTRRRHATWSVNGLQQLVVEEDSYRFALKATNERSTPSAKMSSNCALNGFTDAFVPTGGATTDPPTDRLTVTGRGHARLIPRCLGGERRLALPWPVSSSFVFAFRREDKRSAKAKPWKRPFPPPSSTRARFTLISRARHCTISCEMCGAQPGVFVAWKALDQYFVGGSHCSG